MHFLCEKDSISKRGECIYQNKGNCIPPFSDRHYLSRPMCVSGKYFSCGIQNLRKYVACGILACVASVSVRFRSKEWGTRVKDRAKLAQVKERGGVGEERKETFLPFLKPSFPSPPLPPASFIFWFSFHLSRGQNRKSLSTVFFCSETKRKRLLRRLVRHPESWVLESRIQLKESGIALTIGIQSPTCTDKDWNPVHGIRNPPRGVQNP